MKRTTVRFSAMLVVLVGLILSGCASLDYSEENRSMVLMARDYERDTSFDPYVTYHIYMDGGDTPVTSFKASSSPLVISGLEPGDHVIDAIIAEYKSEWTVRNSDTSFTCRDGYVTVLDKGLNITLENSDASGRTYTIHEKASVFFVEEDRRSSLIADFRAKDSDGIWKF